MHLWSDDICAQLRPSWTARAPLGSAPRRGHSTIADLLRSGKGGVLVGRLVWRSRRFHYGKPGDTNRMPLRAEFAIADRSREIKVVVWGEVRSLFRFIKQF